MLKLFATIITALIVSGCAYTTGTEENLKLWNKLD